MKNTFVVFIRVKIHNLGNYITETALEYLIAYNQNHSTKKFIKFAVLPYEDYANGTWPDKLFPESDLWQMI
jgi:hypothetical protein